jgi:hypothetical protein
MKTKLYTMIGAAVGLALFLGVAMLPAALYGGYAGVLIAGGIFGSPIQPNFLVKTLIMGGMILGTIGIGSLFTVAGAVAGASLAALTGEPIPSMPFSARK